MQRDDLRTLAHEIFVLSGQKVTTDDPVVVAALMQSQLVRQAGADVMSGIQAVGQELLTTGRLDAQSASQAMRDAAAASARALRRAAKQAIDAQTAASAFEERKRVQAARVEAANLRSALLVETKEVLRAVREAGTARKLVVLATSVALVSGLLGAAVGFALGDPTVRIRLMQTWTGAPVE